MANATLQRDGKPIGTVYDYPNFDIPIPPEKQFFVTDASVTAGDMVSVVLGESHYVNLVIDRSEPHSGRTICWIKEIRQVSYPPNEHSPDVPKSVFY